MFSNEFCEIFKNTYFEEQLRKAASDTLNIYIKFSYFMNIFNINYYRCQISIFANYQ